MGRPAAYAEATHVIVRDRLQHGALREPFLKAVADVARGVLSVDCELHIDCADELIEDGSLAADLWGFNIYPDAHLDFVSLINIRPANGNRTMHVQDPAIQVRIRDLVGPYLP